MHVNDHMVRRISDRFYESSYQKPPKKRPIVKSCSMLWSSELASRNKHATRRKCIQRSRVGQHWTPPSFLPPPAAPSSPHPAAIMISCISNLTVLIAIIGGKAEHASYPERVLPKIEYPKNNNRSRRSLLPRLVRSRLFLPYSCASTKSFPRPPPSPPFPNNPSYKEP